MFMVRIRENNMSHLHGTSFFIRGQGINHIPLAIEDRVSLWPKIEHSCSILEHCYNSNTTFSLSAAMDGKGSLGREGFIGNSTEDSGA